MAIDKRDRHVPGDRKMREETPEQKQAFEQYFLMGDDRSYRKLAKALNKSPSSITNWAKWFDWQTKIEQRDQAVNAIVEEKNNKTMAEIKLEQGRQIDAVMIRFWEKVNKGKVDLDSWQDYERLWRIRQDIGGETDRKQSSMFSQLSDAITRGMKKKDESE